MKEMNYSCIDCFMEELFNIYGYIGEYEAISIYAHADVISEIFRELAYTYYEDEPFKLGIIDFDGGGYDYDKEYLLTINDDRSVWIERVLNDDRVIQGGSFINFVHADCNSKILIELENCEQKVAIFDYGKHE